MPLLGMVKRRLGDRLSSGATVGEGTQNLLCAALAGAVLVGLAANAVGGWWWLDPTIGLVVAGVAVKEGGDAWRGEGCACAALPEANGSAHGCGPECANGCCVE